MDANRLADRATRAMVRVSVVVAALAFAVSAGAGVTYNSSGSVPVGLYRVRPLRGDPGRGDVVGVCLTGTAATLARERGYVHAEGLELWVYGVRCQNGLAVIGKPIAGVPGDTVVVGVVGVRINGEQIPNSAVLSRDGQGRRLPHAPWGKRVLGPGEFWLQSPYSTRSFDSRIFGPVGREQIVDRRVPLLTARQPVQH